MNGMAASDKIFHLLDLPEKEEKTKVISANCTIECCDLCFSYEEDREILAGINMTFPRAVLLPLWEKAVVESPLLHPFSWVEIKDILEASPWAVLN